MNAAAYERVLHGAHGLHGLAQEISRDGALDEAIAACERAASVGHVLDPTLYRDRHAAMAQDEEMLRAVRELALLGHMGPEHGCLHQVQQGDAAAGIWVCNDCGEQLPAEAAS